MPKTAPAQDCLTPKALLEFETQSLSQIAKLSYWPAKLSPWKAPVVSAVRQAATKGKLNAHVSFEANDPRAKGGEEAHLIELGVNISLLDHPLVTYFFAIGQRTTGGRRVGLRKIHFDLESVHDSNEPKPSVHFQVAGRCPSTLRAVGYSASAFNHLLPELDKPRIPCLPPSFALLAHIALLEYHRTEVSFEKFLKSANWTKVVTDAEQAILQPYFNFGQLWLNRAEQKNSLLSRFYGLVPG